jgi:hypothetical protein
MEMYPNACHPAKIRSSSVPERDERIDGVGSALFDRVAAWAQLRGCRQLKIETQNTNVRAYRFCERQGCQLRAIHRAAYPELPEEIQLLWYKDLPH